MTNRKQLYILGGLLGVLALVLLYKSPAATAPDSGIGSEAEYAAMSIENPQLRLDRLDRIHKLAYPGMRRNIFSAELPPPPAPKVRPTPAGPPLPPPPPEEIKLEVPFKFYGYSVDPRSGKRRGFFTNGDEVYIANEGDVLLTRYRLLRIGNTTAEVEEVPTGRHATLLLEQAPAAPQG